MKERKKKSKLLEIDSLKKQCKPFFPMYPFKSRLRFADELLYFTKDHTDLEIIEKAGGGIQIPLKAKELELIEQVIGSRKTFDIRCFLIQKCNVQNVIDLSWKEVLQHLSFWLKAANKKNKKEKKNERTI